MYATDNLLDICMLVPGGIIRPVVSTSVLTLFIRYMYVSPRGYQPPSSKYFSPLFIRYIYVSPRGYHPPSR
jgi:hypothetical protein